MGGMLRKRAWLRAAVFVAANLALLIGSSAQGALWLGQATAHAAAPPPSAQSTGRFVPDIHAPTLPTSAWHPNDPGHPGHASVAKGNAASSASAPSAVGRQPGEQADLRTATSSTTLNADGSWTLKTYGVPVHYQDAQGHWQNIDNTIIGDASDAGYAFGNAANSWHVHFARTAGGPKLIHVTSPDLNVAEALEGAAPVAATTSGAIVTYPAVFPGVDLEYQVLHAHLEEELLLHGAQGPASYTFAYHVPGATASQDAQGNVIFRDGSGKLLLAIGGVQMYEADAQGDMLHDAQATTAVTVALAGQAPDYTVTLTPDHAWLANPKRRFPVAIDPTWNLSNSDCGAGCSMDSYGDTFVESGNPDWNFYTTNTERMGNCSSSGVPVGTDGYGTGTNRTYIKFGNLLPPPTAGHVTSAQVNLYQLSSYAGAAQIDANMMFDPWDETTLTWNTNATHWWYVGSGPASTGYNQWVSIDVTLAAEGWWQGTQAPDGLEIGYDNESLACDLFASDDRGSNLPSLTVTFVQDTKQPTGSVSIDNGATYTNNPTASLWTSNVPSGPNYGDQGAIDEWSANWSSVNGVTKITTGNRYDANQPAAWSVDSAGSQLTSDTSTCGGTACWVQTYFSHTINNTANWPTFTAAFKTDYLNNFELGVESSTNAGTRFMLHSNSSGFVSAMVSKTAGSWNSFSMSYPLSTNTWYYAQVELPLPNAGNIYIWPVGQPRPATPTYYYTNLYIDHPGLIFQHNGDNGANLHHFTIGNVYMTSRDTNSGTIGYGISQAEYSNDQTTWSCPAPASGTWCVADGVVRNWQLPSGDGAKTVYVVYRDNGGNTSTSTQSSNTITLDTTPPISSITAPAAGRELRGIVAITTSFSDPLASDGTNSGMYSVALFCDGVQVGTPITGLSNTTGAQFLWDTTNVAGGEHTLTVQVTDNAGNSSTSAGAAVDVSNSGQMPYETFAMRDLPAGGTAAGANVANGAAAVTHQDLDIPGRGPDLAIGRSYSDLAPINNLFGYGWTSDLDEAVQPNPDGSVTYRDPSGGFHLFLANGSGGYTTPPGLYLTLVKNGDGTYTLTARDQTKTSFNVAGYLTAVTDRNGNALSIAYAPGTNLPATMTDASGRQLTFTTTGGHITQVAAPGSRTYTYSYDGNGNLTDFVEDPGTSGQLDTHYSYDSAHRLTAITLNYVNGGPMDQQTNVTTQLTYDSNNRLVRVLDPLGYDAVLTYGAPGSGQTTVAQLWSGSSSSPNPPGCYSTSNPSGNYQCSTYTTISDGSGAVGSISDALGNTTQFQYDSNDDVTQTTSPAGRVTSATYDSNGNLVYRQIDPNGLNLKTTYTYDSANDLLSETDPVGANGYAPVTKYTYDANGNLTQKVEGYVSGGTPSSDTNVTTSYTYDSYGEPLTATDPKGIVTEQVYDSQGDVTETIANYVNGGPQDSQTNVATWATYDALGQQLTTTDALSHVTQNTYDIRGDLMQTVANWIQGATPSSTVNVTTQYGDDPLGRTVSVTNPLGVVTETVYDANGRATTTWQNCVSCLSPNPTQDSQTNVKTTTTYDAAGNTTSTTDAAGVTTTTYDADNRATEVKVTSGPNATPPNAEVKDTQTSYDADGNPLSSTVYDFANAGSSSQTTSYAYDAAGRRTTVQDPPASGSTSGNVTTTTYDADGNVTETKVTNGTGGSTVSDTTASYDHQGRMLSKVDNPNVTGTQTTTYSYDAEGNQLSLKDTAGNTTSSSYDALGRPVQVLHPDGSKETVTYDADGHRLIQAATNSSGSSTGSTTSSYDPLGRLSTEQQQDGSGAVQSQVSYTYDANSNTVSWTTTPPGGGSPVTTTMSYDKLDRTTTLSDGSRSYTYDAAGDLSQMQVYNGGTQTLQAQYQQDGSHRLTQLKDYVGPGSSNPLHTYSYGYDPAGNRNSVTEDGTTSTYTYDGANQLLTVTSGGTTQASYTYDANHNRLSMTTSAGTTSYTYDATATDTRLQQKTDPNGKATAYDYDANGNLLTATYDPSGANQVTTYHYDSSNRLTEIDQPSGETLTFGYNPSGERDHKTVTTAGANPTTYQVNDTYQNGFLAAQTTVGGTLLATFTYNPAGVPESVVVGPNASSSPRYYYVYNGHGDVVALTDASGNVVASYSYDVWGNLLTGSETIPNANGWTNPYRYDGKDGARYDTETGLYWLSTRAYDPTLGRFLQRDPLGRAPLFFSDQPYAYAGNNPLTNVDPSGARYYDGEPETAQQQIAETRRTQQVMRMMPQKPRGCVTSCGGAGGGGGGGGRSCDARGAHVTCQQIDSAKQIAAATATQLLNAIHNFGILRAFGASGALQRFLHWDAPFWIPAALVTAAKAIVVGVVAAGAAIMAQLVVASALFQVQSWQPDSFWENAATVQNSAQVIETDIVLLGGLIAALGVVVALLASNPFTVLLGVGLFAGGALGLFPVLQIAMNGLTRERQALGY